VDTSTSGGHDQTGGGGGGGGGGGHRRDTLSDLLHQYPRLRTCIGQANRLSIRNCKMLV
jgi:hypothetical protein